jgi:hypothetical protein
MTSIFFVATIISVTYFIMKFMEMRYIDKESRPLRILIKDSLIVYFSVIVANFVMEQLNTIVENSVGGKKITPVFTDNPAF